MKALAAFALVVVLAAKLVPAAWAAEPTVTDFGVDGDDLTVGDHVTVRITLAADPGTQVELVPGTLPASVELVKAPDITTSDAEVRVVLTLAVFQTGQVELPPLEIAYVDSAGAVGIVTTPASIVVVGSVLQPGAPLSPRDLKPQAAIPAPSRPIAAYAALGAASIALLLVLSALLFRRRVVSRTPVVVAVTLEPNARPEDEARIELDAAAAQLRAADYHGFYASIAGTVRRYMTERFGFPAFALTTSELQAQMVERGLDRWQARLVGGLLDQCDAVVYAHYRPAPERADTDLTAAYEIVELSRPAAVATESEVVRT